MLRCIVIALALPMAASALAEPELIQGPVVMKPSQIRAYNANLASNSPHYIRCKRLEETGSLVKATRTCRTNQEWDRVEGRARDDARAAVEGLNKGWSRSD